VRIAAPGHRKNEHVIWHKVQQPPNVLVRFVVLALAVKALPITRLAQVLPVRGVAQRMIKIHDDCFHASSPCQSDFRPRDS
jgi:hypothetical protein